jgi:hypothetical protein
MTETTNGAPDDAAAETPIPTCPKCSGEMWDNRPSKRNPKAPDFKCKDKACDGVVWPPRDANAPAAGPATPQGGPDDPPCPVCGGKMWDDRVSKRNPRAPDFKCRNKPKMMGGPGCEGVIWPPRDGEAPRQYGGGGASGGSATSARPAASRPASSNRPAAAPSAPPRHDAPPPDDRDFMGDDDDLPF